MDLATAHEMSRYEEWANGRSLLAVEAAAGDPEAGAACVRWAAHIQAARRVWLDRILGDVPDEVVIWPTWSLVEVCDEAARVNAAYTGWLAGDPDVGRTVTYSNTHGTRFTNGVAHILRHLFAHGGYHRGQIAARLRRSGFDPASTDFIQFLRANSGAVELAPQLTGAPSVDVPRDRYQAIEAEIASDESPVGIDAKKTHIVILHMLERIERRLDTLESRLNTESR